MEFLDGQMSCINGSVCILTFGYNVYTNCKYY